MTPRTAGVSFVLPVYNGRRWLRAVLAGIERQCDGRPFEIIAVDDGSTDGSRRILEEAASAGRLRLVDGPARGIAAAINCGVREAQHDIICQVDQDVILEDRWMTTLVAALADPGVAAAQGHYVTATDAGFWARVMGRDLEQRYRKIASPYTNHVCTGNTAYRRTALHQVGLLDETLGYGSDNDLSYRLTNAGYKLAFCRDAVSVHRWREDARGYVRQQYGVGYGRLDLLARHPRRTGGDDVSGAIMMAHGPAMLIACVASVAALLLAAAGWQWQLPGIAAATILIALSAERTAAGIAAWRHSGDQAALAFGVVHLLRDLAWCAAILTWSARRLWRRDGTPHDSMRRAAASLPRRSSAREVSTPVLAIIPAFNEAMNLERVIRELRRSAPDIDILVINDGSTDATPALLPSLGVRWLTLPQRVGVGGAVRAGLRYAVTRGYTHVVRMDGDGQHRACDLGRLLAPVVQGRVDATVGSRFLGRPRRRPTARRLSQAALARCLSLWTGTAITDPTSGFWLFGPRAVRLLGQHHPTGYGEPELLLFLSRNGLKVCEVPIRIRPRIAGRTSLTPARAGLAFARTVLALMMVPARAIVDPGRD